MTTSATRVPLGINQERGRRIDESREFIEPCNASHGSLRVVHVRDAPERGDRVIGRSHPRTPDPVLIACPLMRRIEEHVLVTSILVHARTSDLPRPRIPV